RYSPSWATRPQTSSRSKPTARSESCRRASEDRAKATRRSDADRGRRVELKDAGAQLACRLVDPDAARPRELPASDIVLTDRHVVSDRAEPVDHRRPHAIGDERDPTLGVDARRRDRGLHGKLIVDGVDQALVDGGDDASAAG